MSTGGPIDELKAALASIDANHDAAIKEDPDPGYVDLAASVQVLNTLGTMLQNLGIDSVSFRRLHIALESLRHGEKPHAMLQRRNTQGTAPDRDTIEQLKGGLAAIVSLGVSESTREIAADWVMHHLTRHPHIEVLLRQKAMEPVTSRRLIKWRERFSDTTRPVSSGRRRYEFVIEYASKHHVSREKLLRALLDGIGRSLPTETKHVAIK